MKFKKENEIVDAEFFDGTMESAEKMFKFRGLWSFTYLPEYSQLEVVSFNGLINVNKNEWLIKDSAGIFFTCKTEEFSKLYRKVV